MNYGCEGKVAFISGGTSGIGMDYGDYPTPKTLTFGANLSF